MVKSPTKGNPPQENHPADHHRSSYGLSQGQSEMKIETKIEPACEGYKPLGQGVLCVHNIDPDKDPTGEFCSLPEMFKCLWFYQRFEPTLSHSSLKNIYCWRKFWWSHMVGLSLIEKPMPMVCGSIASAYLDHFHSRSPLSFKFDFSPYRNVDGNMHGDIYKVIATMRGYSLVPGMVDMKGKVQHHCKWWEPGYPKLQGYMDLLQYEDHIGYEFKYTSRPEIFGQKLAVESQFCAYFLMNPELQRITLRAIQVPNLRQGKNELMKDFAARVTHDVISKPKQYIIDRSYWRNEFNFDEYKEKLQKVMKDMRSRIEEGGGLGSWYKVDGPNTCYGDHTGLKASPCEFLSICTNGVVSEMLYKQREVEIKERD